MSNFKETNKAELSEDVERCKVLFDFFKAEYDYLRIQFYKVEDKAVKLLSLLSVLSGILLAILWVVVGNLQLTAIHVVLVIFLTLFSYFLGYTWLKVLMVLNPKKVKEINYTTDQIEYFERIDLCGFYRSMTKDCAGVIVEYNSAIAKKNDSLIKAFLGIKLSALSLVGLILVFIISKILP